VLRSPGSLIAGVAGLLFAAVVVGPSTPADGAAAETMNQAPRIAVGQAAPAIELSTPDGSTLRSRDLLGTRNLVVVFFRGTW
jgi:cytochrome oxidase Cu insertion factor (SCO1/SenC/PrrC family)